MFRVIWRLIQFSVAAVLAAALAAKLLLESHAGEATDEIDLVNIFGSERLVSSAQPFFGGKVTTFFGGTSLDLRHAVPAPTGIYLDVLIAFGAVSLVVPPGWRVVCEASVLAAGYEDLTEPVDDPDAPLVRIEGVVILGGVRASTLPRVDRVS